MKKIITYLILFSITIVTQFFSQTRWKKDNKNPVLTRGEIGTWNDVAIGSPSIIYDGELFHMWFNGNNGNMSSAIIV